MAYGNKVFASRILEVLEGEWTLRKYVLAKFDSMPHCWDWCNSGEYKEILPIRLSPLNSNKLVIDRI